MVDGLLSEVIQLERGDLLSKSIMKMNSTKVRTYYEGSVIYNLSILGSGISSFVRMGKKRSSGK